MMRALLGLFDRFSRKVRVIVFLLRYGHIVTCENGVVVEERVKIKERLKGWATSESIPERAGIDKK